MRVSRTRFSKRRSKQKTSFPIVAVLQKKSKPKYDIPHSFDITDQKRDNLDTTKGLQINRFQKGGERISSAHTAGNSPATHPFHAAAAAARQAHKNAQTRIARTGRNGDAVTETSRKINDIHQEADSRLLSKGYTHKVLKKSRATIDYKNVVLLRKLITAEGKILPRRINKLTAKQQRHTQKAIKSARVMGLLPFVNKTRPFSG